MFSLLDAQQVIELLAHSACDECHAEHAAVLIVSAGVLEIAARARSVGMMSGPPSQRLLVASAERAKANVLCIDRDGAEHPDLRRQMRDEGVRMLFAAPLGGVDGGALVMIWRDLRMAEVATIQPAAHLARCGGIALATARRYMAVVEERAFLAALVEQSSDALVVADWQNLTIVSANRAAEQLFLMTREELRRVNLEQLLIPEVGDWTGLRHSDTRDEQIALLQRGDGHIRPVGIIPSEVQTNAARFLLLSVRDLHDRWQAIQRLVQSEKLGGMRRLTSSIAHHINNPMQAIATSLRLLQQPLDTSRRDRYLQLAHEEIERLISLVRRTLAVYQPVQESMRAVNIHMVLQSALAQVTPQLIEQGIALEYELAAHTPKVQGFASHLREVFQNLALNALEAMPQGGTLVVHTDVEGGPPDQAQIVIEFADTGLGITSEHMQTIFEPYNSSHPDRAGLGLAISYSIVENHAGHLSVSSSSDGTTFRVILPLLDEPESRTAAHSPLDAAQ
jgi:PAS domain S-box-containing protein